MCLIISNVCTILIDMSVLCYLYLIMYLVLFCFFFFKQKTAYEMRISDWSSDVCSSDLASRMRVRASGPLLARPLAPARRAGLVVGAELFMSRQSSRISSAGNYFLNQMPKLLCQLP